MISQTILIITHNGLLLLKNKQGTSSLTYSNFKFKFNWTHWRYFRWWFFIHPNITHWSKFDVVGSNANTIKKIICKKLFLKLEKFVLLKYRYCLYYRWSISIVYIIVAVSVLFKSIVENIIMFSVTNFVKIIISQVTLF